MELPDTYAKEKYTEQERWLASQIYLVEVWVRQMSLDLERLQERMDKLEGMMHMIRIRLPITITAAGRNKAVSGKIPCILDTLDE